MLNFDQESTKLLFRAVRYYQMNGVVLSSPEYRKCDALLTKLFDDAFPELRRDPPPCDI
jgi:hypothetical protein